MDTSDVGVFKVPAAAVSELMHEREGHGLPV